LNNLLRRKSFFRNDISKGQLGSPPLRGLLYTLKPAWWFSAHLHVRYEARVVHDAAAAAQEEAVTATVVPGGQNPDEINIDEDDEGTPGASTSSAPNPDEIKIEDEDPTVPAVVLEAPTPLKANPDAIMLDDEEDQFNAPPAPPAPAAIVHSGLAQHSAHTTRFLSLDKCLPQREFLEVCLVLRHYGTPINTIFRSSITPRLRTTKPAAHWS
jgi:lariat debranching enzyme